MSGGDRPGEQNPREEDERQPDPQRAEHGM